MIIKISNYCNILYIGCERYVIILHMTSNRQIISKSSLKKGGNIFGQKFWFNAVGKKGRISVDVL